MPCTYDAHPTSGTVNRSALDLVTRVACNLARALEDVAQNEISNSIYTDKEAWNWLVDSKYVTAESRKWIDDHKRLDAERKSRLKESALSKLTADEKEALGL
jgi:hypothetical protein